MTMGKGMQIVRASMNLDCFLAVRGLQAISLPGPPLPGFRLFESHFPLAGSGGG